MEALLQLSRQPGISVSDLLPTSRSRRNVPYQGCVASRFG